MADSHTSVKFTFTAQASEGLSGASAAARTQLLRRCATEKGVGLGSEIADRDVQVQATQITAALLQHHAGLSNAADIGIRLTRKADHEIQLHLAIAVLHGGADAMQQVVISQALVDDVAESLCTGLRGEGQTRFPRSAQDVRDVFIKAIHPLTRQLERDVLIGEAVAQLNSNRRQCQVVTAAEGQQREIAVAGLSHPGFHRFDHRRGFHNPSGARQHPGLTKATAPRATTTNLHRETVMHRFHMWDKTHGVVSIGVATRRRTRAGTSGWSG